MVRVRVRMKSIVKMRREVKVNVRMGEEGGTERNGMKMRKVK